MRLDISFAKKLVSNYKQNHWTMLNGVGGQNCCPSLPQNPGFPNVQDSRSVWIGLNDLKAFINEIEATEVQGNLGVRIYFGEYSVDMLAANAEPNVPPANVPLLNAQIPPAYTGLHTLMMVPTIFRGDGFDHDFDPATGLSDFGQGGGTICALNHGSLMPPPFNMGNDNIGQDFMLFCDQNP